jgi:hypothetical protein
LGQVDNCGGVRASCERRMFFFEMDFLLLGRGTGFLLFKSCQRSAVSFQQIHRFALKKFKKHRHGCFMGLYFQLGQLAQG